MISSQILFSTRDLESFVMGNRYPFNDRQLALAIFLPQQQEFSLGYETIFAALLWKLNSGFILMKDIVNLWAFAVCDPSFFRGVLSA
jgi:hypothetical protein